MADLQGKIIGWSVGIGIAILFLLMFLTLGLGWLK